MLHSRRTSIKTRLLQIRIEPRTLAAVRSVVQREHETTVSRFVRDAIREKLDRHSRDPSQYEPSGTKRGSA